MKTYAQLVHSAMLAGGAPAAISGAKIRAYWSRQVSYCGELALDMLVEAGEG